ncbi:MAG: hypothetical protein VW239_08870 [Candidatus Nanopelagicales bacterium]
MGLQTFRARTFGADTFATFGGEAAVEQSILATGIASTAVVFTPTYVLLWPRLVAIGTSSYVDLVLGPLDPKSEVE